MKCYHFERTSEREREGGREREREREKERESRRVLIVNFEKEGFVRISCLLMKVFNWAVIP